MKEAYVSFETAKLIKEKGFNWPTIEYYSSSGSIYRFADGIADICGILSYQRPTQQIACRWLREEKGIFIDIRVYSGLPVQFGYDISVLYPDKTLVDKGGTFGYSSYEEATENGLKYVLQNLSKYL